MPKQKEMEEVSFFKRYEFFIFITSFFLFIILIILFSNLSIILAEPTCGDGSLYGTCSPTKPYYCDSGFLIEKASICSCPINLTLNGDSCLSALQTEPKETTLKYFLNGEENTLDFTVYGGMSGYLSNVSRIISYESGEKPLRADFKLKDINEEEQRELLLPLVVKIQNLAENKEDQARIAISLVQNIEYGFSNKTDNFFGKEVNYSRYSYEVLYDSQGICGEKSSLLAFLLRELGFETVIFYNQPENHESIGISCPKEKSYKETGYCFIETTGPSIITDDAIEYVGGLTLNSEPEVISISNGTSLPENLPEYKDAETMKRIRAGKFVLFADSKLEKLREKYGLVEEYNIA